MDLDLINKLSQQFLTLASKEEEVPPDTEDKSELLHNLSSLENFKTRLEYAANNLERVSSGSSRTVFLLSTNKVLKLASNEKGISQNAAEAKVKSKSQYVNTVDQCCPNYYWVIAKKAEKITPKKFEKLTKIPFDLFGDALRAKIKENKEDPPKKVAHLMEHPMVTDLAQLCKKYRLMLGDLVRISSYGEINGQPTLIDLGLTQEIYQHFYASSQNQSKKPSDS